MNELYNIIKEELSAQKNYDYCQYLTDHFPCRISGMGDDRKAAEWLVSKYKEFGLEAKVVDMEIYNSNPVYSSLTLLQPKTIKLESRPCCHIASTPPKGLNVELIYIGAGDYCDYEGKDVRGKAVMVEVSYSPATPEKARIAAEMGAAVMLCANWGEDGNLEQDYICGRGLKAVWGNPTPETWDDIPQIVGVGITHSAGLMLKEMCSSGEKVVIHVEAESTRSWDILPMPVAYMRGTEKPDEYLLVNGHLDAWEPGVTCNGSGVATILHLAEVLAKHRDKIKRSLYFINWNGHEIAESACSTWYIDHNWEDLEQHCVGGINIDTTGMSFACEYECSSSRELIDFSTKYIKDTTGYNTECMTLNKVGDQSFFGVGITSIVGRMCMSDEYIEKTHGGVLGWWNHTEKDDMTKIDVNNLINDLRFDAAVICSYANDPVLPCDFRMTFKDAENKIVDIMKKADKKIEMQSILDNVRKMQDYAVKLNGLRDKFKDLPITDRRVVLLNKLLLKVTRTVTWAFYTLCDRFEQNSYAYSPAARPIPFLYLSVDLANMDPNSLEYKLNYTEALRSRNRVAVAVDDVIEYCDLYVELIENEAKTKK
ncbi:MAG: M28 family peptidase [Bacillota bacterium]|nr:M28 family peptidase [Bacillota bacterium]